MTIIKPAFPSPTTADVARRLEKLEERIGSVRADDGSVDMKKLEKAVQEANDPVLEKDLFWVKTEFSTREMRTVTGGCGGTYQAEVTVPPSKLESAQVQSVLSALLEAKARVSSSGDKDGSGRIEREESQRADGGPGLAGSLAREAVRSVELDYQLQLDGWRAALQGVAEQVDPRRGLELNIEGQAKRHCETELGADAVKWAYRKMAISDGRSSDDVWRRMDEQLHDAERSLLRFIPLFGDDLAYGPNGQHLGDGEVKKLLGTGDLAQFARDAEAAVDGMLGMKYGEWLEGKDLAGAEQLGDRDFYRKTSSGC